MTTSRERFSIAADAFGAPVPPDTRFYFRERFRRRLHQLVLREFARLEAQGFTRKQLAARTGKTAAQISRYLSGPGNWTIATVSDLLIGMGVEPGPTGEIIADKLMAGPAQAHPPALPQPIQRSAATKSGAPAIPPIEGQGQSRTDNVIDFMDRLRRSVTTSPQAAASRHPGLIDRPRGQTAA